MFVFSKGNPKTFNPLMEKTKRKGYEMLVTNRKPDGVNVKVLVLHPKMDTLGGGEKLCLSACEALVEDGHEVKLYTNDIANLEGQLKNIFGKEPKVSLVKIFKPFKPFPFNRFLVYQTMIHFNKELKKVHESSKGADVTFSTQNILYCPEHSYTVQYVHFPEYLAHRETATGVKSLFWSVYYYLAVRSYHKRVKNVDKFLCNSMFTSNAIMDRWSKQAEVVYPPVEVSEFLNDEQKIEQVVTVGRFEPAKRYETLLKIASKVPQLPFLIVGVVTNMKYYEHIRESKPTNVELLSNADFSTLKEILSKSMFYLHTMVGEHFGISVVEAMAAGCIPIVHASGGPLEIVTHNVNGMVYSDWTEAVQMIKSATSATNLGEMSRKAVKKANEFDASAFKDRIKQIFREIDDFRRR